jgi:hypothetical protein
LGVRRLKPHRSDHRGREGEVQRQCLAFNQSRVPARRQETSRRIAPLEPNLLCVSGGLSRQCKVPDLPPVILRRSTSRPRRRSFGIGSGHPSSAQASSSAVVLLVRGRFASTSPTIGSPRHASTSRFYAVPDPPNWSLQLTSESVTSFACAKAAPLPAAAELGS